MAVDSGGNVEGSVPNEIVDVGGVKIIGQANLPSEVAQNATDMYGANLTNLLLEFWNKDAGTLDLDPADDIVRGCVITRGGAIVNETIKNL
jgi:NAD(P) transhydrogenase subunit alpha